MSNTRILARIEDQRIEMVNVPLVASGSKGVLQIQCEFDSLWSGYSKSAVFYKTEDEVYHIPLSSSVATVPHEMLADDGEFFFGVIGFAENDRTTEVVRLQVKQGAISKATATPKDPTPDIYRGVVEAYGKMEARLDQLVAMQGSGNVTTHTLSDEYISGTIVTNGASAYINFTISGLSIKAGGEYYTNFCIPAELASLCQVQLESTNSNLVISVRSASEANGGRSRILIENVGSSAYTADMETTSRGVYPLKSVFIPELADIRVDSNGEIYVNAGDSVRTNMQNRPQYNGKPKPEDYNRLTANLTTGFFVIHRNDWDDIPSNPADRSDDPIFALLVFRYSPNYNIQKLYGTDSNFKAYRIVHATTGEVYKDWWSESDTIWVDVREKAQDYDNKISNLTKDGSYRIDPADGWTDHPFDEDSCMLVFRYTLNYVIQICVTLNSGAFATRIVHLTDKTVWRDWKGTNSDPVKILVVGDSIAYGWRNSYKGFVGDLGYQYRNEGVSGSTISNHVKDETNIPDQLLGVSGYDPDVIIAEGGINDYIYNAPMGDIPTALVKTDSAANALNRDTVLGGLQFLLYKMVKLYPKAQRFFLLVHKVTAAPDRNPGQDADFSKEKQDYTTTPNNEGYTQTDLFDAIKKVCALYNVKIIDVFSESMINTAFPEYVSPVFYSDDKTVTNREFVDADGLHPLDYGYRHGYLPIVKRALQIGTIK